MTGFLIGDRALDAFGDVHPAWMIAHAEVGPYWVVGGSAIGKTHLAQRLPREDAFAIRSRGPWLAVGMSDGVSSSSLSRYGATYAVEELVASLLRPFGSSSVEEAKTSPVPGFSQHSSNLAPPSKAEEANFQSALERLLEWQQNLNDEATMQAPQNLLPGKLYQAASVGWFLPASSLLSRHDQNVGQGKLEGDSQESTLKKMQDAMQNAFKRSFIGLQERAENWRVELTGLSCTGLALLLNIENGYGVVGQIGDGALLGLTEQGKVKQLVRAPQTEHSQSVHVLTSPNFEKYLAYDTISYPDGDPFIAFYVMSDGISNDLLYSPEPLKNWAVAVDRNLHSSVSPTQAASEMLNWLATYQVQGSWDDRTLIVITRRKRSNGHR